MENQYTYTTSVSWLGERKGELSGEGLPQLPVATPPEFPNGHEGFWSPESYFVASITSCIMSTFLAIAENSKLEISKFSATGTGTLERSGSSYEFTAVEVEVSVTVADESAAKKAERTIQKAEENCFISRSIKAEVEVKPNVSLA